MTGPMRDPGRRALLAAGVLLVPGLAGCSGTGSPIVARSGTGDAESSGSPGGPSGSPGAGPAVTPGSPTGASSSTTESTSTARPGGPDITHGPAGAGQVALTFHGAGDPVLLQRMLATFAEAGARMTVMAIGQWLAGEPRMARSILDGGHELGNHTWSHQTMPRLDAARARDEVDRAAAELRRLTGSPGRWFRPSGTPHSTPVIRAAAVAAGYGACLAYDVDPMD
jgi:hypothetical protein